MYYKEIKFYFSSLDQYGKYVHFKTFLLILIFILLLISAFFPNRSTNLNTSNSAVELLELGVKHQVRYHIPETKYSEKMDVIFQVTGDFTKASMLEELHKNLGYRYYKEQGNLAEMPEYFSSKQYEPIFIKYNDVIIQPDPALLTPVPEIGGTLSQLDNDQPTPTASPSDSYIIIGPDPLLLTPSSEVGEGSLPGYGDDNARYIKDFDFSEWQDWQDNNLQYVEPEITTEPFFGIYLNSNEPALVYILITEEDYLERMKQNYFYFWSAVPKRFTIDGVSYAAWQEYATDSLHAEGRQIVSDIGLSFSNDKVLVEYTDRYLLLELPSVDYFHSNAQGNIKGIVQLTAKVIEK